MAKKKGDKYAGLEEILTGALGELPLPDADLDDIVFIDVDGISSDAKCDAYNMVENLMLVYGDQKFMEEHPDYKKRIDIELENMRTLIKMKRSDEIVHDVLVKAIGKNPTNASLYTALNKMQSSILSIQKQMDETIKNLNNLLKNYQFELPFKEEEELQPEKENIASRSVVSRGNKEFIMEQLKLKNEESERSAV